MGLIHATYINHAEFTELQSFLKKNNNHALNKSNKRHERIVTVNDEGEKNESNNKHNK
jgi:hypothetical protein